MTETYRREDSDIAVSIGHERLIANVTGFAREVVNEDENPGILIFIPTCCGKSLLDIIKVKL